MKLWVVFGVLLALNGLVLGAVTFLPPGAPLEQVGTPTVRIRSALQDGGERLSQRGLYFPFSQWSHLQQQRLRREALSLSKGTPPLPQEVTSRPSFPVETRTGGFIGAGVSPDLVRSLRPFGLHRYGFSGLGLYLASFGVLLGVFAATLALMPTRARRLTGFLARGWRSALGALLLGLAGYAVVAIALLLLLMIVVGIPLALLLLLALALATILGLGIVALTLGQLLARWIGHSSLHPLAQLLLGWLVLFPLGILPVIAWPAVVLSAAAGLGTLLATRFGSEGGWSLEPLRLETTL